MLLNILKKKKNLNHITLYIYCIKIVNNCNLIYILKNIINVEKFKNTNVKKRLLTKWYWFINKTPFVHFLKRPNEYNIFYVIQSYK